MGICLPLHLSDLFPSGGDASRTIKSMSMTQSLEGNTCQFLFSEAGVATYIFHNSSFFFYFCSCKRSLAGNSV